MTLEGQRGRSEEEIEKEADQQAGASGVGGKEHNEVIEMVEERSEM